MDQAGKECMHCGYPLPLWRRLLRLVECGDCLYRIAHGGQPMNRQMRQDTIRALKAAYQPSQPYPEHAALAEVARVHGLRYYGSDGTIHGTEELNVEVFEGEPVAVWFRCQRVPFDFTRVERQRADEMLDAKVSDDLNQRLVGLVLRDPS